MCLPTSPYNHNGRISKSSADLQYMVVYTHEHVVLVSGSLHSPTGFNIFLRCRLMIAAKAVWDTPEVVYNTARGNIPVPPWRAIYSDKSDQRSV